MRSNSTVGMTANSAVVKTAIVWILTHLPYRTQPFAGSVVRAIWPGFRGC